MFVSGNHDLGNTPTPDTVEQYCRAWGDDYFSFWVGGVLCLVLNSQLFFDASGCPQLEEAHEVWLEKQLQKAAKSSARHVIIFQHIPLYLKSPDEEDDYFNLQRGKRENLIRRFCQAGTVLSSISWLNLNWMDTHPCCVGQFNYIVIVSNDVTMQKPSAQANCKLLL